MQSKMNRKDACVERILNRLAELKKTQIYIADEAAAVCSWFRTILLKMSVQIHVNDQGGWATRRGLQDVSISFTEVENWLFEVADEIDKKFMYSKKRSKNP